jgi:hypothetical protein
MRALQFVQGGPVNESKLDGHKALTHYSMRMKRNLLVCGLLLEFLWLVTSR